MTISPAIFGDLELYPIETGRFMLDGGAMFGVVPKTLWSRQIPADEKNRIPMAMRCMLIKSNKTGKLYLVDNGSGDKFNEKMTSIYGLDYETSNLDQSLKACGVTKEDITDIIFTHLHFDHCGGTTSYDSNDNLIHNFPNATYHVNKRHWANALNPNAREKASFLPENINPIKECDRLNLVDDDHVFEENLSVINAEGHTIGQQLPKIEGDGRTLVFAADLIPTFAHVPIPWVMGYDMYPVKTLKEKKLFLHRAASENWLVYLEHDAKFEIIKIEESDGRFNIKENMKFGELT